MSHLATPPLARSVEWECMACLRRSPYVLPLSAEREDLGHGYTAAELSHSLLPSSVCGGTSTEEGLGSTSAGPSSALSSPVPVAYDSPSSLTNDDEERSFLSQTHRNKANMNNASAWDVTQDASPASSLLASQAQSLRAAQQQAELERLIMEEGLLGKRQMRYCRHCGYARCAEVREVMPHSDYGDVPTTTTTATAATRGARDGGRTTMTGADATARSRYTAEEVSAWQPHARTSASAATVEANRSADPRGLLPRLPGVVQHWWRKGRDTAQRWNPLQTPSSSSSTTTTTSQTVSAMTARTDDPSATAGTASSTTTPTRRAQRGGSGGVSAAAALHSSATPSEESVSVPDVAHRLYASQSQLSSSIASSAGAAPGGDVQWGSEVTAQASDAVLVPRDALWGLYTTEEAFWRLTLPAAAPPFLDATAATLNASAAPPFGTTRSASWTATSGAQAGGGCVRSPTQLLPVAVDVPYVSSQPSTPLHVVLGGDSHRQQLSPSLTPTRAAARCAPSSSSNSPGRRVGYRQEVKTALQKLDNVQLNVARMRLEQALQLLADEEQHRRMSHD